MAEKDPIKILHGVYFEERKKYYTELMRSAASNHDTEVAHGDADDLLCMLLKELGFDELVAIFEDMDKWYA